VRIPVFRKNSTLLIFQDMLPGLQPSSEHHDRLRRAWSIVRETLAAWLDARRARYRGGPRGERRLGRRLRHCVARAVAASAIPRRHVVVRRSEKWVEAVRVWAATSIGREPAKRPRWKSLSQRGLEKECDDNNVHTAESHTTDQHTRERL
jgi:hypothetical protein